MQQESQADGFDVPLLLGDLIQPLRQLSGQGQVGVQKGVGCLGDGILAEHSNGGHFLFQPFQLHVKFGTHYPNLPVI